MGNTKGDSPGKRIMITVETTINKPVDWVWRCFTEPAHITKWNFASEDWHCPFAENTLKPGGTFKYRMASKDGKAGFDFEGIFNQVEVNRHMAYTIGDRSVTVDFIDQGDSTRVVEIFEAEETNPIELQRNGRQAILDNFKKHAEESQG